MHDASYDHCIPNFEAIAGYNNLSDNRTIVATQDIGCIIP